MPDRADCMCAVCLTSSPRVESRIDASPAPPPVKPEGRIDRWHAELKRLESLPPGPDRRDLVRTARTHVAQLWAAIDDGPAPTVYAPPTLKGGKS